MSYERGTPVPPVHLLARTAAREALSESLHGCTTSRKKGMLGPREYTYMYRGTSPIRKHPPPTGPPKSPRHTTNEGSSESFLEAAGDGAELGVDLMWSSGSMKVTTHLYHISHCKTSSGTNWLNIWTCRVFIIYSRRDENCSLRRLAMARSFV